MSEEFDVTIIGSGVSGLLSAALLSRSGMKVLLLEKHYLIGGYLQGFERRDFVFDTAIHWLNQYNEKGTVTRVFKMLGEDFPKPQLMKRIQRHISNHHDYLLTNNPDELRDRLIRDFPHEQSGITRFFKVAKRIAKVSLRFPEFFQSVETKSSLEIPFFRMKQLGIIYPLIPYAMYSGDDGVKKGLSKFFKDPKLQELFCTERDLLSCIFPIAWAYNSDYQNPPIGGSQVIPGWLEKQVDSKLCDIRLNSEVIGFEFDSDRISGVRYKNRAKEYLVKTKYVIAACDVDLLYRKLVPAEFVPKKFFETLSDSEMYSSSVTISVALDCPAESLGFGHELTLICEESSTRDEHSSGDPRKSAISVLAPTVRDRTLSPEGKGILTLYVPAWMDYMNNWETKKNAKGDFVRTEAYKKLKDDFAQVILDRVSERMCPDLRNHILFYEVATPVTYYRYTGNKNGTMMGTRPGKKNMQSKIAHYRTLIENLVIGGQWAELGGGVPIAVKTAFNASLIILKKWDKTKFQKLLNAYKKEMKLNS
ncbi:NAD(P)/FAD-dependent oxidoreductase [Fluviicola sp.]|jgi:prolycopene isomerase|uniref:phytoene desaturase family protein n=1 Tax=Fluviicola sp. TaxID=1917219 RepID=UPI002817ED25|nr:NAD(P)/FAD-dependent oxidoreductase [Fluviicola sp.]MDR0801455.1 NAD(P)/FAD-dependent oxidoreductase [Fluviicola sp.]